MALYENLPVFKDTYQLLLQFMEMSRKLERDVRYSIGEQVNEKQHAILIDTLVGVSKQLSQWESYTKDKKKGTSGEDGAVCFESPDT